MVVLSVMESSAMNQDFSLYQGLSAFTCTELNTISRTASSFSECALTCHVNSQCAAFTMNETECVMYNTDTPTLPEQWYRQNTAHNLALSKYHITTNMLAMISDALKAGA